MVVVAVVVAVVAVVAVVVLVVGSAAVTLGLRINLVNVAVVALKLVVDN